MPLTQAQIDAMLADSNAAIAANSNLHTLITQLVPDVVPPTIANLTATPAALPYGGGAITIDATVVGADAMTLDGQPIAGLPQLTSVTVDHTFTLAATNTAATVQATASVTVAAIPAPTIANMTALPAALPYGGGTVTVNADVTYAETLTLDGAVIPALPADVATTTDHTFTLVATNATGQAQASASVTVAAAPPSAMPLWLKDAPLNQWTQVPNSRLMDGDLSGLATIPGAETGKVKDSSRKTDPTAYDKPVQNGGIDSQSGGTFRIDGSELLIFGGGGAGSWAGNDIRGLRLEDDAPKWIVRSSPAGDFWPRLVGATAHAYTQTSKQPAGRHSYFGPQFCDATDQFFIMSPGPCFETDSIPWPSNPVERLDWPTKQWVLSDATNRSPNHPTDPRGGWVGAWIVKHPATEHIYRPIWRYIHRFDPKANGGLGAWHGWEYTHPTTDVDYASACVDPDHNLILAIGQRLGAANQNKPMVYDISVNPYKAILNAEFSGPQAALLRNWQGDWACGMVWDAGLHCFLWYQDDGFIYTITRGASNSEWLVDRLPLTGSPPAIRTSGRYIYNRMQYAPHLKGVAIMIRPESNCYFVRTT